MPLKNECSITRCNVKYDNANIIKFLQDAINKGGKDVEYLTFMKDFSHVIFNFIYRNCNKIADFRSNYAIFSNFIWEDFILKEVPRSF